MSANVNPGINGLLHVRVVTPHKTVLDVEATAVHFPTTGGVVGILPGHAPLICQLGTGVLFYDVDQVTSFLSLSGGIAQIDGANQVVLLADLAEDPSEIDVEKARRELAKIREILAGQDRSHDFGDDLGKIAEAEAKAIARIQAYDAHAAKQQ